ncbi:MAG: C2H2-type zinc finger protein [Candidatus Micrarchaeota archaeon]|nr:C2H2-type zinc finger protein [Candidatus Micrarchaeota archaeon]
MGEFPCNECRQTFGTYYELREHKAASHKERPAEPVVRRFGR